MKQKLFKGITNRPICAEFIMMKMYSRITLVIGKFRGLIGQDQIDIY